MKDDNLRALKKIAEDHPETIDRIIPQIYAFEEYEPVWDMGYRNIILTLYVKNYADEPVLGFAQSHRLFGVTMWAQRAMGPLPRELERMKIPVSRTPSIRRTSRRDSSPTGSAESIPISWAARSELDRARLPCSLVGGDSYNAPSEQLPHRSAGASPHFSPCAEIGHQCATASQKQCGA